MALNVRIADWEASSSKSLSTDQLEKFERDLSVLKDFDARNKLLQGKVCTTSDMARSSSVFLIIRHFNDCK